MAISSLRIRRTLSSIVAWVTWPEARSGFSVAAFMNCPEGISRSRPPFATPSVSWAAPQSDMRTPWKAQSPFSTLLFSQSLALQ